MFKINYVHVRNSQSMNKNVFLKLRGWRDGSAVKNTECPSRGSRIHMAVHHCVYNSSSGNLIGSMGIVMHIVHRHTCGLNTQTQN